MNPQLFPLLLLLPTLTEKNQVSSSSPLPLVMSREKNQVKFLLFCPVGHFEETKRIKLKAKATNSSSLLLLLFLRQGKRIKSLLLFSFGHVEGKFGQK